VGWVGERDAEPVPIAALNDFLYCPRRCGLHRVEGLWEATASTVSGTLAHRAADDAGYRQYLDGLGDLVRVERAIPLWSRRLGLVGRADIVEFHWEPGGVGEEPGRTGGPSKVVPVDYKLGARRKWDNDDVQLCAQGLCLEEMLGLAEGAVGWGAVYHVKTRRRREVEFTTELRRLTAETVERVRGLLEGGRVPRAVLKPQCDGCSVRGLCMPELTREGASLERAHRALFSAGDVAG
jgi:CRISPR-associated exonuclease Cas4